MCEAVSREDTLARSYLWAPTALLLIAGCLIGSPLAAQDRPPYTLDQLIQLLESGVFSEERVITLTEQSCLAFGLDEGAESRLRASGASNSLIRQLRGVCTRLSSAVASVRVTPSLLEIAVDSSGVLQARAFGPDTVEVPGVSVDWSSDDSTIARVMDGTVVGVGPGTTTVSARTTDGIVGLATVTVGAERSGAKSTATAAALGVVVPGGGEFYTGNAVKGAIVLAGVAGALAAGYLITKTDTSTTVMGDPVCSDTKCTFTVQTTVTESRYVIAGVAVAAVFWTYGLIDGIISAKKSQAPPPEGGGAGGASEDQGDMSFSIQLVPPDGLAFRGGGEFDITLIRVRL